MVSIIANFYPASENLGESFNAAEMDDRHQRINLKGSLKWYKKLYLLIPNRTEKLTAIFDRELSFFGSGDLFEAFRTF